MSAAKVLGAAGIAGIGYFLYQKTQQPALVRAQSDAGAKTKRMVRRASAGDHAFLPNRQEREAVRQANTAFGVDKNHAQDRVGDRLPTTRGY